MIQLLGANLATQAGSQILQGIGGIASGIAGSRQRRREQADAARSYTDAMARFENIDTSNPYANITNPYANLTVNQQQADFMAQQTQQASANTMSQLRGAAGSSGIAALAQAMANQQSRNLQQASATIGAQEAANQRLMAQGNMQTQMARAQGDYLSQRMQANQATTQLAMAQRRKAAADQARQQATGALIGGIGKIAGGVMAGFTADKALKSIGMDGLFGKNTADNVVDAVDSTTTSENTTNLPPIAGALGALVNSRNSTEENNSTTEFGNAMELTQEERQAWEAAGGEGFSTVDGVTSYGGNNLGKIRSIMQSDFVKEFGEIPSWLKTGNFNDWKNRSSEYLPFNIKGARIFD